MKLTPKKIGTPSGKVSRIGIAEVAMQDLTEEFYGFRSEVRENFKNHQNNTSSIVIGVLLASIFILGTIATTIYISYRNEAEFMRESRGYRFEDREKITNLEKQIQEVNASTNASFDHIYDRNTYLKK